MKKTKNGGIIYTVQCNVTGEFYVGATTESLKQRKLDHIERAKRGENGKFYEAISTYGADAFEWKQTDTCNSLDDLAQKEKQYIIEYNAKEEGYNSDAGGGFKKTVYQYDLETGEILNQYESLESAGKAVNASKKSINNVCLGINKSCKGYYWSYQKMEANSLPKDTRPKRVRQFDMYGEILKEYKSAAEASRLTGISKTCITRCCRGEREQSGGFCWYYI